MNTAPKHEEQAMNDTFRGDNVALVNSINALLSLDEAGALVPHGIGGHARKLLQSAAARLAALAPPSGEGVEDYYVAWMRYSGQSIVVCDSDAPRAFKVYRHPASQSAPVIVTEEMIDAALIAWLGPPYSAWDLEDPDYRISMQKILRAALTTPQSAPVDEFSPTGKPQEAATVHDAVMLAEYALWQDDEGVRWVPEAAYQRMVSEVERLETILYPMGDLATTPPPASQERGVIGEVVSAPASLSGMNVIRWVEGFTPMLGMKLFASEHKHDLVHNIETDTVTCRGCDYLSSASQGRGHECSYPNGDGPCPDCHDLALPELIRKRVEKATTEHCQGADLWLSSKMAADEILGMLDLLPLAASPPSSAAEYDAVAEYEKHRTCAAEQAKSDECHCPQHGSWIAADDVKRLVREIDVYLNGEDGAAKQASLCDIAGQLRLYASLNGPLFPLAKAEQAQAGEQRFADALSRMDQERTDMTRAGYIMIKATDYDQLRRLAGGVTVDDEMVDRGMDGAWNWTKAHADYDGAHDEDWRNCDDKEAVSDLRGITEAVIVAALGAK